MKGSRYGLGFLGLLCVAMFVFGLADDLVDLRSETPLLPDRLLVPMGPFLEWQAEHPALASVPAWVDMGASVLLTLAGAAFLLGMFGQASLAHGAFVIALGVLDETDAVPVAESVSNIYWAAYWAVLLAAIVQFASRFPYRLEASNLLQVPGRTWTGRRWAAIRRSFHRFMLHPAGPWVCAAFTTFVYYVGFDAAGDPRPGRSGLFLAFVGLTLIVFVMGMPILGIRYFTAGYHRASPASRRRALWMVQACISYLCGLLLLIVLLIVARPLGLGGSGAFYAALNTFYLLVVAVTAVFFLVAIFHRGAVNPALVIRRTFVVTAITTMALVATLLLQSSVSGRLLEALGLSRSTLSGTIMTTLIVLFFIPVRSRVGARLDPWVMRLTQSLNVSLVLVEIGISHERAAGGETGDLAADQMLRLERIARRVVRVQGGGPITRLGDRLLLRFYEVSDASRAVAAVGAQFRQDVGGGRTGSAGLRAAIHKGQVTLSHGQEVIGDAVSVLGELYAGTSPGEVSLSPEAQRFVDGG